MISGGLSLKGSAGASSGGGCGGAFNTCALDCRRDGLRDGLREDVEVVCLVIAFFADLAAVDTPLPLAFVAWHFTLGGL